jgi:hypothetical protein
MRRSLWTTVLVTVLLLVLAGNLSTRWPASWTPAWGPLADAARDQGEAAWLWLRTPLGTATGASVLAWLSGLTFGLSVTRRRDRFAAVLREVRRGRATARIARRTRLSQDAVRALLHAGGGTVRPPRLEEASGAEGPALPRGLRPTTGVAGTRWSASA